MEKLWLGSVKVAWWLASHALWLMAPSFLCGILPLEVDKWLMVMILQESCGLCKGHCSCHSGAWVGKCAT